MARLEVNGERWLRLQLWHLPIHFGLSVLIALVDPVAVFFMATAIEIDQWLVLPRPEIPKKYKLLDGIIDWFSWVIFPFALMVFMEFFN